MLPVKQIALIVDIQHFAVDPIKSHKKQYKPLFASGSVVKATLNREPKEIVTILILTPIYLTLQTHKLLQLEPLRRDYV